MESRISLAGILRRVVLGASSAILFASIALSQTTVLVSGLKSPEKILLTERGNLLVAEAGTGPNTGRVSIVDRAGNRRTLIDNLPSGLAQPNGDPDGPTGLAFRGMTLFISIGVGDTTLAGPMGTETPNPNPSSQLFSSVLQLDLTRFIDSSGGNFVLTAANQTDLKNDRP